MGAARRNAGHAGGARDAKRAPRRAPSAFKRQAYFALEDVRRGNAVARIVGIALFALIVANAILVFAETQPGIPAGVSAALLAFGLASSVCFGLEYAARLWTADLVHPDASPARARMRYALSPMGIIDLLAFAPGLSSCRATCAVCAPSRACSESAARRSWRHSWCSPCSP